ncbi:MAG: DUF2007 domain-containing protein [Clostridiales bacterium]|nr:DUF2007 domain-containing protein [Clostridiales bacterium]
MWTVVYVSQNKAKVDRILELLDKNSIMTMLKTTVEDDFQSGNSFEILVPKTELETAQNIIFDLEV